jgi:hypothetical protein
MRNVLQLLSLACLVSGCAALGTSTLYKSNEKTVVNKIGFTKVHIDGYHPLGYSKTIKIFLDAVSLSGKEFGLDSMAYYNREFDFDGPWKDSITSFCEAEELDGILIATMKQFNVNADNPFDNRNLSADTRVQLRLFGKNGTLLFDVSHNTKTGNSYFGIPTHETTIRDGTRGALKRMAEEIRKSNESRSR